MPEFLCKFNQLLYYGDTTGFITGDIIEIVCIH